MADVKSLEAGAKRLRELHQVGRPLLLVNIWDAAVARAVVAAGSQAVATSSVAMAAARAGSDANRDREAAFGQLRQISAAVDVPVTADLEGGYDLPAEELVETLLQAGAVGCNIEDTDHATGIGLLDAPAHAGDLAAIRAAADRRRGNGWPGGSLALPVLGANYSSSAQRRAHRSKGSRATPSSSPIRVKA